MHMRTPKSDCPKSSIAMQVRDFTAGMGGGVPVAAAQAAAVLVGSQEGDGIDAVALSAVRPPIIPYKEHKGCACACAFTSVCTAKYTRPTHAGVWLVAASAGCAAPSPRRV